MSGFVNFTVTDKSGAQSTQLLSAGPTGNIESSGENFMIAKEQVTSILDASNLSSTDVGYKFDAGNRLDFFSKSAGEGSRIVFTTNVANTGQASSAAVIMLRQQV